jgi:lipopolysaccharide/colanic/teichoic acid biosynthesis glycosyltransferase
MQRFFDVLFSGLALLVLSPLLIPIALVLRFSGEGEVFFMQARVGKDGTPFQLFKFATMLKNSPNLGTGTVTLKDDPRVLPVGKFLRKTKINELPQLLKRGGTASPDPTLFQRLPTGMAEGNHQGKAGLVRHRPRGVPG